MSVLPFYYHFIFQYMGDSAPEKVKNKIVEMLYSWTVAFPNEPKISEAYQTLRRQGTCRWWICGSITRHR